MFQSPLRGEVFGTCSFRDFDDGKEIGFSRLYAARCSGLRPGQMGNRKHRVSVAFTRRGVRDVSTWRYSVRFSGRFQSPLRGEVFGTTSLRMGIVRFTSFSRLYAARCSGRQLRGDRQLREDRFQSPLRGEVFGTRSLPSLQVRSCWSFSRLYAARCSGP